MKSRQSIAAALGLALFLSLATFGSSAQASCSPHTLKLTLAEIAENLAKKGASFETFDSAPRARSAAAGQKIGLVGVSFYQTCYDVGNPPPPKEPVKKIRIFFRQGSQKIQINTVDANKDLSFAIAVSIPADAAAGAAELIAEWFPDEQGGTGSTSVPITVTR